MRKLKKPHLYKRPDLDHLQRKDRFPQLRNDNSIALLHLISAVAISGIFEKITLQQCIKVRFLLILKRIVVKFRKSQLKNNRIKPSKTCKSGLSFQS